MTAFPDDFLKRLEESQRWKIRPKLRHHACPT